MEKEELVKKITDPGSAGTHGREGARAQLDVVLSEELNGSLRQLYNNIFQLQKVIGTRLSELTTQLDTMGQETSSQSKIITKWTKVLVWATITYTLLTGINILVVCLK